jgi:hypothetical protein
VSYILQLSFAALPTYGASEFPIVIITAFGLGFAAAAFARGAQSHFHLPLHLMLLLHAEEDKNEWRRGTEEISIQ